jgi:hypothetical protein
LTIFLKFALLAGAGSRLNAQQTLLLSQPEDRAARVKDAFGL